MSGDNQMQNGYVTWKGMVGVVIAVFGLAGTLAGYALSQHAEFQHKGSISKDEYYNDLRDLKENVRDIKQLIERVYVTNP